MPDRDDMIRKVQALWAKADSPAATDAEKESAIAKARELMAKYTIDELVLAEAKGTEEAIILSDIRISTDGDGNMVNDQRILLSHFIAMDNRCKTVIQTRPPSVSVTTGQPVKAGQFITVVGFKSDVDLTRDLYFSIGLDMMMAVNDEPTNHMKKREKDNYAANFCDAFALRIHHRLMSVGQEVERMAEFAEGGSLLPALLSRKERVDQQFAEMFPDLKTAYLAEVKPDPNAQARGKAAADRVDVGQTKVGGGSKGAIGGGDGG